MLRRSYLYLGLLLFGCGQFPNPNDLATIPQENRASIAYERLIAAQTTLDFKVQNSEITDSKRFDLSIELAEDLLKTISPDDVPSEDQWKYATLLRLTGRWKEAEAALKVAVKVADTPSRKVEDTLRLAQAEATNGGIEAAIKDAASVMDAKDEDAAPILLSVLDDITPSVEGKGHDKELADLLTRAVECQMRVKVDPNSDAGRQFLIAKRYHIRKAEEKISELTGSKG